jgi:hypothetical protein
MLAASARLCCSVLSESSSGATISWQLLSNMPTACAYTGTAPSLRNPVSFSLLLTTGAGTQCPAADTPSWHPNLYCPGLDTYCQHLPGVLHCVQLIEMIFTAVTANLQLGPNLQAPRLHPFCPVQGSKLPLLHYVSGHQVLESGQLQTGCLCTKPIRSTARVHNTRMHAAAVCLALRWGCCWRELTLYVAPASFAAVMLSKILLRFPSKSIAHWFRLHVARVASLRLMTATLQGDPYCCQGM